MSAFQAGAKPHLEAHEKIKQEVYLVADGQPLSRLEICNAALKNDLYFGSSITKFNGDQIDGKKYDTEKIKRRLNWTPNYIFSSFMAENNVVEMKVPLLSKLENTQ